MPKVNFGAVATEFAPREAGDYECTFVGYQLNPASATSGQPTIRCEFSENDSPNKKIFKTYSLQPQALFAIKRDLIRMGASVEDMNSEEADIEEILDSLIGAAVTVVMGEPREYTDKNGDQKLGDNFKEIRDPTKVGV